MGNKYSPGFREAQLKKVLPPNSESVAKVARNAGISEQTLRNWIAKAKNGTLSNQDVAGNNRSSREKYNLLMESKTIAEAEQGKWLREKGLHSEHITLFDQEIRDLVDAKGRLEKEEIKKLRKENKWLSKELDKKEKALAEMAALYTLKKKAEALWAGNGVD